MPEIKEPVGKLRILQVFTTRPPFCDRDTARAKFYYADDQHTGFALCHKCADELNLLQEWRLIAEMVSNSTEPFILPIPSWLSYHAFAEVVWAMMSDLNINAHVERHQDGLAIRSMVKPVEQPPLRAFTK